MNNSPFELFRRNLKPAMILLTGLAIFAFVILPVLDQYMRRNSGVSGSSVVANYGGRTLTANRVGYFTRNHQSTVRFLTDLAKETMNRGGTPRTANFVVDPNTREIQSIGINSMPSSDATIRTFVYAAEAEKAGFELDDNSIRTWLESYTDGAISDSEITAMLMNSTQNQMGRPHLYEQLRSHLLADVYLNRGVAGVFNGVQMNNGPLLTPTEQWTNFIKINQSATVDSYGVLVNDFIDQTNDSPPESEIIATYEAGKDNFPEDQSSEPAFRRRYATKIEYLVGNYQKFLDEEIEKLGEDTIRAEYDRRLEGGDFKLPERQNNVDINDVMSLDASEEAPSDESSEEAASEGEAAGESEAASEEAQTQDGATELDSTNIEATEPMDAVESTSDASTIDSTESSDIIESQSGGLDLDAPLNDALETDAPSEVDQSSMAVAPVRLVALLQEEQVEDVAQEETGTEVQIPDADASPIVESEESSEAEVSADQPIVESPSSESATSESSTEETSTGEPASDEAGTEEDESTEQSEPRVETFEDVRDRLAEELAGPAARGRMDAAVTQLYKTMRTYFTQKSIHESNVLVGKAGEPPAQPDLKALAEELGFERKTIPSEEAGDEAAPEGESPDQPALADQNAMVDEPIMNSFEVGSQFGRRGPGFSIMMFGFNNGRESLPAQELFSPVRTADDADGKMYVSWKVGEEEAHTPDLEEVRSEVIMAIRMKEALEIAKREAEDIAKRASDEGDRPLEEFVPDEKKENVLTDLGPFKWMDSFGFGATIGNVERLDAVGEEFMQSVFESKVGDYVVAGNNPGRVVYVVKPTKFEPSMDELRRQFKEPMNRRMVGMMDNGSNKIVQDFITSVNDQAGFEDLTNQDQQ